MKRLTNEEILEAKTIAELAQSRRDATDSSGWLALLSKNETVKLADGFMQLINERRWIPVEEALPEAEDEFANGGYGKIEYLVVLDHCACKILTFFKSKQGLRWADDQGIYYSNVTHWRKI
jgi:hypothetical protein